MNIRSAKDFDIFFKMFRLFFAFFETLSEDLYHKKDAEKY